MNSFEDADYLKYKKECFIKMFEKHLVVPYSKKENSNFSQELDMKRLALDNEYYEQACKEGIIDSIFEMSEEIEEMLNNYNKN